MGTQIGAHPKLESLRSNGDKHVHNGGGWTSLMRKL